MEILLVIVLLLVVAALTFLFMRSRSHAPGRTGLTGRGDGIRGWRRAAAAARHDPMAEAVERHSAATDPHEAAEEELRLRAQANRVASDLHAQEAAALESQVGHGGLGRSEPVRGADPGAYDDGRPIADEPPAYVDENGRPVYEDDRPRY
jgi:hypothetical protein